MLEEVGSKTQVRHGLSSFEKIRETEEIRTKAMEESDLVDVCSHFVPMCSFSRQGHQTSIKIMGIYCYTFDLYLCVRHKFTRTNSISEWKFTLFNKFL
jgi:hypothetical protein